MFFFLYDIVFIEPYESGQIVFVQLYMLKKDFLLFPLKKVMIHMLRRGEWLQI